MEIAITVWIIGWLFTIGTADALHMMKLVGGTFVFLTILFGVVAWPYMLGTLLYKKP